MNVDKTIRKKVSKCGVTGWSDGNEMFFDGVQLTVALSKYRGGGEDEVQSIRKQAKGEGAIR